MPEAAPAGAPPGGAPPGGAPPEGAPPPGEGAPNAGAPAAGAPVAGGTAPGESEKTTLAEVGNRITHRGHSHARHTGDDDDVFLEHEHHNPAGIRFWPDAHIPYCVEGNSAIKAVADSAMAIFNLNTNVKFKPYKCDEPGHKVKFFHKPPRPYAHVGMRIMDDDAPVPVPSNAKDQASRGASTFQEIAMELGVYGSVMYYVHEIGHTLNFWHTQMRSDWNKCYTGVGYNATFEKENCEPRTDPNSDKGKYDFESIMHYPSGNTCGEIKPHPPAMLKTNNCVGNPAKMGNIKSLSAEDIVIINAQYNHDDTKFH